MALYVIGSISKDTILRVHNFPPINEESFSLDHIECYGGGGANVAVYAKTVLKMETYLVSCVGADSEGKDLVAKLHETGVNTSLVKQIDGSSSTRHTILLDGNDNRVTYVHSGAMEFFSPLGLKKRIEKRQGQSIIICPMRPNSILGVFGELGKSTSRVFFIPGSSMLGFRTDFFDLLPKAFCLILNKNESLRYCGCKDVFQAAQYLLGKGVGILAITLGQEGSLVFQGDTYFYTPSFNVEAVLSVGCGDAFAAGFAGAIIKGQRLEEAALTGNKLGAFMATQPNMLDSPPSKDQLQMLNLKGAKELGKKYLSTSLFKKKPSVKNGLS